MSAHEMPLKQWLFEEAARIHVSPRTVERYFERGQYANLPLRRVNRRVIFVQTASHDDAALAKIRRQPRI